MHETQSCVRANLAEQLIMLGKSPDVLEPAVSEQKQRLLVSTFLHDMPHGASLSKLFRPFVHALSNLVR